MSDFVIILVLVLANGIFSGAEISVISVRKSRVRELAEAGGRRARALFSLRARPDRFLATVQVGITVTGATAAAIGGACLAGRIAPWIAALPLVGRHASGIALALVIAIVTFLTLVLGELVPKSLALRKGERYALLLARPLVLLGWLVRPLEWLLTASSNLVLRPFGDSTTFAEAHVSANELQSMVDEATRSGALDSQSGEIASRALEFGGLTAGAVMVPRNRILAVHQAASPDEIRKIILESGRSRLPVYGEDLDDIVGYIRSREVLTVLLEGKAVTVQEVLRPVLFVPRGMRAVEVLRELQRRQSHIAIVVDEHGGVSGLVTLEDLIEELVGDIFAENETPAREIQVEAEGMALAQGCAPIREINRALSIDLVDSDSWNTIGGMCMALAGGIPRKGDRLQDARGVVFEIVAASQRAVDLVRVIAPDPTAETSGFTD